MLTKFRVLIAALLGVVLIISIIPAQPAAATSIGLLTNGGFESYTVSPKIPDSWKAVHFGKKDGIDTLAADVEEGLASVRIVGTPGKTKTLTQINLPMSGGTDETFTLSYYVKGLKVPKLGSCLAKVVFYNFNKAIGSRTVKCGATRTFDYRLATGTFHAPGTYTGAKLIILYNKASGKVWFDNINLDMSF